jgi:hypothetical protein
VDKRRGAQDAQITFEDPADLNKEIKEVRWKRQWADGEMAGLFSLL